MRTQSRCQPPTEVHQTRMRCSSARDIRAKKDSIGGQVFIGRCIHQPPGGACYEANRGRVNIRSSFGRMVASIKKGRDIQTQQVGRQMSEMKTRGTRVDSYTADV